MNFERGKDPKEALGIGVETMLKEIGGIIFNKEDFIKSDAGITMYRLKPGPFEKCNTAGVVIAIYDEKFRILKNRYGNNNDDSEFSIIDLPKTIREIYEVAKNWTSWDDIKFPKIQTVAARTIAHDLVPVTPMAKPKGFVNLRDFKYGRKKKTKFLKK